MAYKKILTPVVAVMDALFLIVSACVLFAAAKLSSGVFSSASTDVRFTFTVLYVSVIAFSAGLGIISVRETILNLKKQRFVLATLYSVLPVVYWVALHGVFRFL